MRTRPTRKQSLAVERQTASLPNRRERQIVRILALLRVLGRDNTQTVHELAKRFRTRRETIYRDLRVLQDAGYPIAGDEQGRLSRPKLLAPSAPDIRFTTGELDALRLAVAQAQIAVPNKESLLSAARKLQALADSESDSLPPGLADVFESWTCGSTDYRPYEDGITRLIEAILRKRRCLVEYQKPTRAEPKQFEFDPYRLLFVGGGLYVVGRVPKYGGTATLAIGRLLSVTLGKIEFEIDPAFNLSECRRKAFGVSWQEPEDVVLRFRADQAPYVRERLWHPSQKVTDLPDGGIQLTFRAGGPFEIRRWILGWADAVEVIAPEALRRHVRDTLSAAGMVYHS